MGDDISGTKLALILAAEELFARQGIDGARATDILRAADQANESAINYHFGSRWGLVEAIIVRHLSAMEAERVVRPGPLRELVADLVAPAAARLTDPEGRNFLRILQQVVDRATPQSPTVEVPAMLEGTRLLQQLAAISDALTHLPPPARASRIEHFIVFHVAALGSRARRIDSGDDGLVPHEEYLADLVDVLTAVLETGKGKTSANP